MAMWIILDGSLIYYFWTPPFTTQAPLAPYTSLGTFFLGGEAQIIEKWT